VLTATDAQFTATFPGKPSRTVQHEGPTTVIEYLSTLSGHAVGVTYVPLTAPGAFNLDDAINGAAQAAGGTVLSRTTLTYLGQFAEDAVISVAGGTVHLRAVVLGSAGYILEGAGTNAANFANDYDALLSTFTSTSSTGTATPTTSTPGTPGTTVATGSPPAGGLGSELVQSPDGFAVSQDPAVPNGTINASAFDAFVNTKGAATDLHYVNGYSITYDAVQSSDSVGLSLFQFATAADAAGFLTGFSLGPQIKTAFDHAIPGAQTFDSTTADSSGTYQHGVLAAKGDIVIIIDYSSGSPARPALVDSMAAQEYERLTNNA
jgi:hypothetical protein